jgi:hypothetical protein
LGGRRTTRAPTWSSSDQARDNACLFTEQLPARTLACSAARPLPLRCSALLCSALLCSSCILERGPGLFTSVEFRTLLSRPAPSRRRRFRGRASRNLVWVTSSPRYARTRTNFPAGIFAPAPARRALQPVCSSAPTACVPFAETASCRPPCPKDPVCCLLLSRDLGVRYTASGCPAQELQLASLKSTIIVFTHREEHYSPSSPEAAPHSYCSCRPCSHRLPMICKLATCSFPLVHRQTQSCDSA